MTTASIKGKKLNKGEWAEFYVLLKLLGDGRLYAADELLRKKHNCYLDILRVIRQELDTITMDYCVDKENSTVIIKTHDDCELVKIPMIEFSYNAQVLFEGIKDLRGKSVEAPDSVCDFAKVIYVSKPKAPAVKAYKRQFGGKNDIFLEVRDGQTSIVSIMGFSIKSKFGENPTLFNAGSSSQLLYKVSNCTDFKMDAFNSIKDGENRGWSICKTFLQTHDMNLTFARAKNPVYDANMFLVRESMNQIMAWCFEDRLLHAQGNYEVKETVERMAEANPLNVPNPGIFYEKAMKDFLMASFTGMTAAKQWDGREQVSGGYIVVMEDGDVLCYHSADRESFRDYLYKNTFFEYVSTTKYSWSKIFEEDGEYYLPLNASIRFTKRTR